MSNQYINSQKVNGRNINEMDLNDLKQMDYQKPAREFILDTQEIIKDKDCWCERKIATRWFKIRKVEYSQHLEIPTTNDEIWGRCDEHLSELKEKDGKIIRVMMGWQVRYYIVGEIKKMTDEEVEAEKEVEKCDCQSWINQEQEKYLKDKAEDLEKYNTLTDLIDGVNALKDKQKWDDKETYKNREIGYIVKNLEKDRNSVSSMINHYQRNLTQLDQWEHELKEILTDYETK